MAGQKFIQHDAQGGFREVVSTQTGGTGNEEKIVSLDSAGRLNANMMPTGIGADTAQIVAPAALAAGDFVNVYNNAGTANVRKADASSNVAPAHGFVLTAVTAGGTAEVYFEGTNTAVAGQTPGPVFLSASTAGGATTTAPATASNIVQKLGTAVSATAISFEPANPITLA